MDDKQRKDFANQIRRMTEPLSKLQSVLGPLERMRSAMEPTLRTQRHFGALTDGSFSFLRESAMQVEAVKRLALPPSTFRSIADQAQLHLGPLNSQSGLLRPSEVLSRLIDQHVSLASFAESLQAMNLARLSHTIAALADGDESGAAAMDLGDVEGSAEQTFEPAAAHISITGHAPSVTQGPALSAEVVQNFFLTLPEKRAGRSLYEIAVLLLAILQFIQWFGSPAWDVLVKSWMASSNEAASANGNVAERVPPMPSFERMFKVKKMRATKPMDVRMNGRFRSPPVGFLRGGQVVIVVESGKDWTYIEFVDARGTVAGWVLTRYLERYGD